MLHSSYQCVMREQNVSSKITHGLFSNLNLTPESHVSSFLKVLPLDV